MSGLIETAKPMIAGTPNNYVRFNEALAAIDGLESVSLAAADVTATIGTSSARKAILNLTGTLGAARFYAYPAGYSFKRTVANSTSGGQTVTVKVAGGTGIEVPAGAAVAVWSDGTNLYSESVSLAAGDLPSGINANKIADASVSNAEFQRLNGVTGDIQTQLDNKAPAANPAFTGTVTIPTVAGSTDNSTKAASTAFVQAVIAALINLAPGTLDTLGELAAQMAADESAASALATTVAGKLAKANNLDDLTNVVTARSNLGLAALALLATVGTSQIDDDAVTYAKLQNLATNKLLGRATGGTGNAEEIDLTAAGRALLDDADAAAQRTTLGVDPAEGNQAANTVKAGPTSGGAAAPGYRVLVNADLPTAQRTRTVNFIIDGGGSAITTGVKGDIVFDFACSIQQATVLLDQSGSIVIDLFKCTYSQFDAGGTHPVSGDKITASAPPTVSSATKAQDATLTGWTTAISAGDILRVNVNSIATAQRATLSLKVLL